MGFEIFSLDTFGWYFPPTVLLHDVSNILSKHEIILQYIFIMIYKYITHKRTMSPSSKKHFLAVWTLCPPICMLCYSCCSSAHPLLCVCFSLFVCIRSFDKYLHFLLPIGCIILSQLLSHSLKWLHTLQLQRETCEDTQSPGYMRRRDGEVEIKIISAARSISW